MFSQIKKATHIFKELVLGDKKFCFRRHIKLLLFWRQNRFLIFSENKLSFGFFEWFSRYKSFSLTSLVDNQNFNFFWYPRIHSPIQRTYCYYMQHVFAFAFWNHQQYVLFHYLAVTLGWPEGTVSFLSLRTLNLGS